MCSALRGEQVLHRNVQRFRGGLVFKAHRLCVSLNSRLKSSKEEEKEHVDRDWFESRLLQGLVPPHLPLSSEEGATYKGLSSYTSMLGDI